MRSMIIFLHKSTTVLSDDLWITNFVNMGPGNDLFPDGNKSYLHANLLCSVCETTSAHQLLPMLNAKFFVWKCTEHHPKCCHWPMLLNIVSQTLCYVIYFWTGSHTIPAISSPIHFDRICERRLHITGSRFIVPRSLPGYFFLGIAVVVRWAVKVEWSTSICHG